jgi:DNA-binding winged helix-turn-helix (wHTH) protein/tetratricopeptide (TPR) repeat protein
MAVESFPFPVYRFGAFHLDCASRRLSRDSGAGETLPTRLFRCISYLIAHRDRAVGRAELIRAVWGHEEAGDNLLGQLIVRARRLFEDGGTTQGVIRTVPGFGYQWVIATDEVPRTPAAASAPAAEPAAGPAVTTPASMPDHRSAPADAMADGAGRPDTLDRAPHRPRSWVRWAFAAALLIVAAGLLVQSQWRTRPSAPHGGAGTAPALAATATGRPALVLPALVDAEESQDWLQLGIMALVSQQLVQAGYPTVPGNTAVALTRPMDLARLDAQAYATLADAAAAGWIVQPRVERSAGRWRVSLSIVHGEGQAPLRESAEAGDAFDAAYAAGERFLDALQVQPLAPRAARDGQARASRPAAADPAAVDAAGTSQAPRASDGPLEHAYQQSLAALKQGDLDEARSGFEALLDDPGIDGATLVKAGAHVGLADIATARGDDDALLSHAQTAIDLLADAFPASETLGKALLTRATGLSKRGEYNRAYNDYARARELLAATGNWLDVARVDANVGIALRQQGRIEEALPRLQQASKWLTLFHGEDRGTASRVHLVNTWLDLADPISALAEEGGLVVSATRTPWPPMRTYADLARADVLIANGLLTRARPLVESAYAQAMADSLVPNRYAAHVLAARLATLEGEPELTRRELDAAIAVVCTGDTCGTGDGRGMAWSHVLLARLQQADDPAAAAALRAALARRMAGYPLGYPRIYLNLMAADEAIAGGDTDAARLAFQAALAVPDHVPIDHVRVAQTYVPWLLAQGDVDAAEHVIGLLGGATLRHYDAALLKWMTLRARQAPADEVRQQWERLRTLAGERPVPAAETSHG